MGLLSYTDKEKQEVMRFCLNHLHHPFRRACVTKDEWLFLYDLARELRPSKMMEIGCYLYTSSLAFLKAMDDELNNSLLSLLHHPHLVEKDNLLLQRQQTHHEL